MVGGGADATEGLRSWVARGRPNWWVILAVSLALMAILVETSGNTSRPLRHVRAIGGAASHSRRPASTDDAGASSGAAARASTTTTTTTTPPSPTGDGSGSARSLLSTHALVGAASTAPTTAPPVTTTTLALPTTTTTSTSPGAAVPADRTQTQGYLNPPLQTSNGFGFTGTGAMEISVVWSSSTYLTMQISCPTGSQSVGGTSVMAASLPDARGSCVATVSEPATESASLTYTITIGPAGG